MALSQFAPDIFSRHRISLADIDAAVSARLLRQEDSATRNPLASTGKSGCIWQDTWADGVLQ